VKLPRIMRLILRSAVCSRTLPQTTSISPSSRRNERNALHLRSVMVASLPAGERWAMHLRDKTITDCLVLSRAFCCRSGDLTSTLAWWLCLGNVGVTG